MKMLGRLYKPEVDENGFDKDGFYCGKGHNLWILEWKEDNIKFRSWFVATSEEKAKKKVLFVYRNMKFIKE